MDKTVAVGDTVYFSLNCNIHVLENGEIIVFQPLEKYFVKDISSFCDNLFFLTVDGFLFCYHLSRKNGYTVPKFNEGGIERFIEISQFAQCKKEMAVYCKNKLIFFGKQFIGKNTSLVKSWEMDLTGKINTECVNNLVIFSFNEKYAFVNTENGFLVVSTGRKKYIKRKCDKIQNIKKIIISGGLIGLLTYGNDFYHINFVPHTIDKYMINNFIHTPNVHNIYGDDNNLFVLKSDRIMLYNRYLYQIPSFFPSEKVKHVQMCLQRKIFVIINKRVVGFEHKYGADDHPSITYKIPVPKMVYLIVYGHYDKNSILNRLPFDVLKIVVRYFLCSLTYC